MKSAPTTAAILFVSSTAAFTQAFAGGALEGDTDGDGFLSPVELHTLYANLPVSDLAAGFEQVDIDQDGLLNDDEIALARESGIFPPAG